MKLICIYNCYTFSCLHNIRSVQLISSEQRGIRSSGAGFCIISMRRNRIREMEIKADWPTGGTSGQRWGGHCSTSREALLRGPVDVPKGGEDGRRRKGRWGSGSKIRARRRWRREEVQGSGGLLRQEAQGRKGSETTAAAGGAGEAAALWSAPL